MNYKLEILKSEDKNNLVLSSKNLIYEKRIQLNENSDLNQFPLVKQLFFLPFIKSVILDKHLIIIEKLDFLNWEEVQDDVIKQLENYLNNGGVVFSGNINAITVYAESTPNPNVMKFVCNRRLVNISHEFKKIDDATKCYVAKALFIHEFIKEIFIDFNFISVTINSNNNWDNHTLEIREFILSYIKDGNEIIDPAIDKNIKADKIVEINNLDEVSQKISELIETQIKPAVASDGGNILFKSYDKITKEVNVILQGACSGCPSSTITLKNGIETMLKNELPGKISNVVAING
tara:strand:+ start:1525 stop:2400 length:876 start_codon:yes stop_codon:yes gene_type:complete